MAFDIPRPAHWLLSQTPSAAMTALTLPPPKSLQPKHLLSITRALKLPPPPAHWCARAPGRARRARPAHQILSLRFSRRPRQPDRCPPCAQRRPCARARPASALRRRPRGRRRRCRWRSLAGRAHHGRARRLQPCLPRWPPGLRRRPRPPRPSCGCARRSCARRGCAACRPHCRRSPAQARQAYKECPNGRASPLIATPLLNSKSCNTFLPSSHTNLAMLSLTQKKHKEGGFLQLSLGTQRYTSVLRHSTGRAPSLQNLAAAPHRPSAPALAPPPACHSRRSVSKRSRSAPGTAH